MKIKTEGNILAVDTETTGLNGHGNPTSMFKEKGFYPARIFAFSFCDNEGNTHYEKLEVNPFTRKIIEPSDWKGRSIIQKVLNDENIIKVFHNAKFDLKMLKFSNFSIKGKIEDTMIMAHILTGGTEPSYGLKQLADKYLQFSQEDQDDLKKSVQQNRREAKKKGWKIATPETHGSKCQNADYWLGSKKLCRKYAIQDVERTVVLYQMFLEQIELYENKNLLKLYKTEMKLLPVLMKMELRGINMFPEKIKELTDFYEKKYTEHTDKSYALGLPKTVLTSSPKQLGEFFFNVRGLDPVLTEKGNYSCSAKVMEQLAKKDNIAKEVVNLRKCSYAVNNFLVPYNRCKVIDDNKNYILHPNYRQMGTVTGRLSAGEPNVQNISSGRDKDKNKDVDVYMRHRELFGPRKGHYWYLCDYSQKEVWIFALLSGDKKMMEILISGEDFHSTVAENLWGHLSDYEKNKKRYRNIGKGIMFCRLYGGGVNRVAEAANVTVDEAKKFVEDQNKFLPGIVKYQKKVQNIIYEKGKLTNLFGREYYLSSDNAYKGVNYMVQGTCSDIMKRAMILMANLFLKKWIGCHIQLTIHDEIVVEVPFKYHSKKLMRDIITCMQKDSNNVGLSVPLGVGIEITKTTWANKRKIKL